MSFFMLLGHKNVVSNCFQIVWVGPKMKEEKEIILYQNKGATVAELLEEAKRTVELSPDGTGKLR